jgi:type IV fimbrial biogenesis protein FimT
VRRDRGFTVVELMMTLVVMAVIVALGAPGMRNFIVQSRMTSQINELLADVSYARNEAATRGVRIGFCASSTATTATPTCSSSLTDWSNGRLIFIDTNGDGQINTSSGSTELLLKASATLTGGSTLTISQTGSTSPPASFLFRPYGGIATPASGSTVYGSINGATANAQVSFKLCPNSTGVQGRQLDIALTGRPNVYKVGC